MKRKPSAAFGNALVIAMRSRGFTNERLADAVGTYPSTISAWRGGHVPIAETVAALAHALESPNLITVARKALTRTCRGCKGRFVQHAKAKLVLYCAVNCKARHYAERDRAATLARRPETMETLKGRVQSLEATLEHLARDRDEAQSSIDAHCLECEPEGLCRTPLCRLRGRSPLPLAEERLWVA